MARDDNEGQDESRASASVLLNGLHVLEAFSIDEPVLGVTEIARKVHQHKSTVSRILATLERAGYVERDDEQRAVSARAGPDRPGRTPARRPRRTPCGAGPVQQLTEQTGETTALMVWNGHESVVVEQVQSPKQVKHTAAIGTRYDTYESASVKVFLAALPPGRSPGCSSGGCSSGPTTSTTVESYVAELDQVAEQGFAINDGRTSVEEVGVAAPVRDHRGLVVAAVLLSAPRFRVPPAMLDVLARSVAETASVVSARLGGAQPQQ